MELDAQQEGIPNEEAIAEAMEANGGDLTDEQMAAIIDGEELPQADGSEDSTEDQPPADGDGEDGAGDTDGDDGHEGDAETSDGDDGDDGGDGGDGGQGEGEGDGEEKPVILAKDGKHTIPYQELADTRAKADEWKEIAEQKDQLLREYQEKLAKAEELPADEQQGAEEEAIAELQEDLDELSRDYPEVAKQFQSLLDTTTKLASQVEELKHGQGQTAEEISKQAHFDAIRQAHEDFDEITQGDDLEKWVASRPKLAMPAYQTVLDGGTAEQVIELLNEYKQNTQRADTGGDTSGSDKGKSVQEKAEEAIAKAGKQKAPNSLSDMPGGTTGPVDEAQGMLDKPAETLMDQFDGMSKEQIEAKIALVL